MDLRFDDKVVLVTGAAGGIGAAAAEQFAASGARVLVADRNLAGATQTVDRIAAAGGTAIACEVDVADPVSVDAMVARCTIELGGLDCAFNNAGISPPQHAFHSVPSDEWAQVIAVNLSGVFWCMQAELRAMVEHGRGGAIVNTSSGAGIVAAPGLPAYTAAKHGVLGLVKSAAQEYARQGIRVNAVLPGPTDTPMMQGSMEANPGLRAMIEKVLPLGRMGTSEEVAAAAVWLCSDAASLVSGVSLVVDGAGICR